jgi:hypothetical protein
VQGSCVCLQTSPVFQASLRRACCIAGSGNHSPQIGKSPDFTGLYIEALNAGGVFVGWAFAWGIAALGNNQPGIV